MHKDGGWVKLGRGLNVKVALQGGADIVEATGQIHRLRQYAYQYDAEYIGSH